MELEDVYARNEEIISRRIVNELILVPLRKVDGAGRAFCPLSKRRN